MEGGLEKGAAVVLVGLERGQEEVKLVVVEVEDLIHIEMIYVIGIENKDEYYLNLYHPNQSFLVHLIHLVMMRNIPVCVIAVHD